LKPDVPTVKPICIGSHDRERTVKSLGFLNSPPPGYTPKGGRNQTGSGLYHPIVKELVLPGRQEELRTNHDYTRAPYRSQGGLTQGWGWFGLCSGHLSRRGYGGSRSHLDREGGQLFLDSQSVARPMMPA